MVLLTSRVSRSCPTPHNPEHFKDLKAGLGGVVMGHNDKGKPIVKFHVDDDGVNRDLVHVHDPDTLILADQAPVQTKASPPKAKAKAKAAPSLLYPPNH